MAQKPYQADMQQHMQALTELRQYVRAEQNRPVLGASKQGMQGGGPGMGNLSSILQSILGGGGGQSQQMMGNMGRAAGGMPAPMTSSIASGAPPEGGIGPGTNPGSVQAMRQRQGGLVPMPGMRNYSGLGMM